MREYVKPYMSTGEFARLCGTTKDTLFHYDRIGLLRPEKVSTNGYRSYSLNQYLLFMVIVTLKEAGTPLADIKEYIGNQEADQLLALLTENKRRLEKERERIDHTLVQLESVIETTIAGVAAKAAGEEEKNLPRREWCEEELLVITPLPGSAEEQDDAVFIIEGEAHVRYCAETGLNDDLMIGCIKKKETFLAGSEREDYLYSRVRRETDRAAKRPGVDENRLMVKPAGYYAVIEHLGAYETIEISYARLADFIKESGFRVGGDAYEMDLLNFMGTADPNEYVVRIAVQIEIEEHGEQSISGSCPFNSQDTEA